MPRRRTTQGFDLEAALGLTPDEPALDLEAELGLRGAAPQRTPFREPVRGQQGPRSTMRQVTKYREPGRVTSLLRGIDLFAGAGGFTIGAIEAGCPIVFGVERQDEPVATSRRHGLPIAYREVGEAHLWEDVLWGVDLLIAGPPCQPFSEMGGGAGQYDPRDGIPLLLNAVVALGPRRMVFENVKGFASERHRRYREKVLLDLARHFSYVGVWLLDAADFGVPQHRERVFVWGAEVPLEPPVPTHGPNRQKRYLGVIDALPRIQSSAIHVRSQTAVSRSVREPSPTVATRGTIYTETRPGLVYGRDPHRGRRLTPQELQILQSFPGVYSFSGNLTSQYRQIGNAVPPLLGEAVVKAVLAGIVADPLDPREVCDRLVAENPDARLFEPRDLFDRALIGVTNVKGKSGEIVAVYSHEGLMDVLLDEGWKERGFGGKTDDEIDQVIGVVAREQMAEEVFNMASDWLWNDMYRSLDCYPHMPVIFHEEELVEWDEEATR